VPFCVEEIVFQELVGAFVREKAVLECGFPTRVQALVALFFVSFLLMMRFGFLDVLPAIGTIRRCLACVKLSFLHRKYQRSDFPIGDALVQFLQQDGSVFV